VKDPEWRDGVFTLERSLNVANGVSSVFPMLFLALSGSALVFGRLRDLYLFDQCMPHYPMPRLEIDDRDDPMKKADVRLHNERHDFEDEADRFWSFVPRMARSHLVVLTLGVLFLGHFLLPLGWRLRRWSPHGFNGRVFDYQFSLMIMILFLFVTLNSLRLALMWESVERVMKLFLQLPQGSALARMNARVSRWFFEASDSEGTRFDLIRREADTLARLCDGNLPLRDELLRLQINDEWDRASGAGWEQRWGNSFEERWARLPERLRSIDEASVFEVRAMITPILRAYWRRLSIAEAFPNVGTPAPKLAEPTRPQSDPWWTIAAGIAPQPPSVDASEASLVAWVRAAEDLLSLLFVSWLAVAMEQIWTRIGSLVVAVLALLLAVVAYPSPIQHRFVLGLGLLIAFLAALVGLIVLGVNREELISRVANTAPNRLKLDRNLISSLLTYVLPLLGAVIAALSFNASDTLHTFLDPILHQWR
jgi:hypothetical protein